MKRSIRISIEIGALLLSASLCPAQFNLPDQAVVAPVAPAMPRAEIEAGLKSHNRALYIKQGWIRDPYITLGPDEVQRFVN